MRPVMYDSEDPNHRTFALVRALDPGDLFWFKDLDVDRDRWIFAQFVRRAHTDELLNYWRNRNVRKPDPIEQLKLAGELVWLIVREPGYAGEGGYRLVELSPDNFNYHDEINP